MKYKEFKDALDKQFADNDEIFPHAGTNNVVFARDWHGQDYFPSAWRRLYSATGQ